MEIGVNIKQPNGFKAFTPHPFPPKKGFAFNGTIEKKASEATRLLGKLDGITKLLPNADYFLLMYLCKDATSSSQIEGTQATMMDAIEAGAHSEMLLPSDVDDILHYIDALNYGLSLVQEQQIPISNKLIRELHKVLMSGARATHFSHPGEFRESQNWIGGTRPDNARYVPPNVDEMHRALTDLERFIHAEDSLQITIKAGLIHAQFETIHPFSDGNGRTGRMLITFYLWHSGYLEKPVLFLSSYFKRHQKLYYERLDGYHNGEVNEWVDFFLEGIIDIAKEAIHTVEKITVLREQDMGKVQTLGKRASESAVKVLPQLYAQPIVSVALVQAWTGFTFAGAQNVIDRFIELDILVPRHTEKKYGQTFFYKAYTDIFTEQ